MHRKSLTLRNIPGSFFGIIVESCSTGINRCWKLECMRFVLSTQRFIFLHLWSHLWWTILENTNRHRRFRSGYRGLCFLFFFGSQCGRSQSMPCLYTDFNKMQVWSLWVWQIAQHVKMLDNRNQLQPNKKTSETTVRQWKISQNGASTQAHGHVSRLYWGHFSCWWVGCIKTI